MSVYIVGSQVFSSLHQALGQGVNILTGVDSAFPNEINGTRDSHGTSCAGIIAMEKSNNVCGVGVAYKSQVTGKFLQLPDTHCQFLYIRNSTARVQSDRLG